MLQSLLSLVIFLKIALKTLSSPICCVFNVRCSFKSSSFCSHFSLSSYLRAYFNYLIEKKKNILQTALNKRPWIYTTLDGNTQVYVVLCYSVRTFGSNYVFMSVYVKQKIFYFCSLTSVLLSLPPLPPSLCPMSSSRL